MKNLCAFDVSDTDWDAFVGSHPQGHHEQSSQYARSRAAYGFQSNRIAISDGIRIVGGVQILVRNTPIGKLALILRGPLAADENIAVLNCMVKELDRLAEQQSYASVRVDTFPTQAPCREALARAGFQPSKAWHGVMQSLLVPLNCSNDELLTRMKPKGRYNVRQAKKAGVTISPAEANGIPEFLALHTETAKHQGFPVFSRQYYEELFRVFGGAHKAKIFIAHFEETPVAAICNMVVGGRMYYCWGGISRDPEHRKLMANYLLHFSAMEWAREQGCTHYDLVGVTEFKEKIGRELIEWPQPLRKFYGRYKGFRSMLLEKSWAVPLLHRATESLKHRMAFGERMPF